eukprot:12896861-Prorocentrum_lima.AAC.1
MKLAQELFMILHMWFLKIVFRVVSRSILRDILIDAINGGILPNVDKHPPFRELMKDKHKAYHSFMAWLV